MSPPAERAYRIGPLAITAAMDPGPAADVIEATLGLYDVRWPDTAVDRRVRIVVTDAPGESAAPVIGDYLEAANMLVDRTADGLRASTLAGAHASGSFGPDGESWRLDIPHAVAAGRRAFEIEDLLSLVLTTGWRRAGWVPLHGGGLVREGRGLLCVATSGGGKTTFTVSLIRRGWRALGDDKVLLTTSGGAPRLMGLLHVLNLDPRARAWFPEVGDLADVAPYSEGSPKRRQPIEGRWPGGTALEMAPTDLLVLERSDERCGIVATPLSTADVAGALLRQTVVPRDPEVAAMIVRSLGAMAVRLRGWRVVLGCDAYEGPEPLDGLEAVLGSLVTSPEAPCAPAVDDELDVSVIVPVLDGARTMPSLLRNLMTQVGAPERREILIIDNGSTDGSQAIARATPGVTLLEAPIRGVSAARNVGLHAARGRIVACIDVDAQPTRRWLADLLAGFTDESVVLVAGGLASYPPSTAAQRFSARRGLNNAEAFRLDANSLFANGRNLAVRREAALAIGGWSEDMLRGEDIDFSIRLIEASGRPVVLRESAVIFHHDRETDEELRLQALGYGYGMALLYDRYPNRYPWGWRQRWAIARRSGSYLANEAADRLRGVVGRADPNVVEQRIYERRWHFWYLSGFFQTRRGGGLPR